MIEYNERTVYSCFGKYFSADYGSPELNPPPIPIDSDYRPKTLSWYTTDQIPADIIIF